MRVLLASDTYPPDVNGAARFTERLAKGLASRGHEVHELAPSSRGAAGSEEVDGVLVHRLRSHRYRRGEQFRICMPWEVRGAVSRLVGNIAPDVVHVQSHFVVGRYAAYAAARAEISLVATNHFMPDNLVEQLPIRLTRRQSGLAFRMAWRDLRQVYSLAQVVTAPTPRAAELLARTTGLDGIRDISCGVDTDFFSPVRSKMLASVDAPTILFVGRLEHEKRLEELVDAFARLPAALAARMMIIGDGTRRAQLAERARALGIAERVLFRGFVSEVELREAYRTCSVFCMPGVAELQSLATLEAMASGMPVVAAEAMAIPHLVRPNVNGWLYSPGRTDDLAAALTNLLADPVRRQQMGSQSRQIALGHGIERTVRAFEDLYLNVENPEFTRGRWAHAIRSQH